MYQVQEKCSMFQLKQSVIGIFLTSGLPMVSRLDHGRLIRTLKLVGFGGGPRLGQWMHFMVRWFFVLFSFVAASTNQLRPSVERVFLMYCDY